MIAMKMMLENSVHRQGHWHMNNQDDNVVGIFVKEKSLEESQTLSVIFVKVILFMDQKTHKNVHSQGSENLF